MKPPNRTEENEMLDENLSEAKSKKKIKHLIVLCDGTGQSSSRANTDSNFPTNVKTFGDCLSQSYQSYNPDNKEVDEIEQVIYYQSGIGTSTTSIISRALASGVAYGIQDHILDAYYFLCSNYDPGDKIFIFGFSRGAFIARILANLVVRMGLLRMNVSWMIRRAWAQYMKDDGGASFQFFIDQLDLDKYKGRTRHVKVTVLGVWDTVAAVGLSTSCQQHDTRLHWGIENVFHALALDEKRLAFGPTLFYHPSSTNCKIPPWLTKLNEQEGVETKCNLKQCWFAGAHTDIGGGYISSHQSNITLAWMIDNCQGLLGFNNEGDARKWKKIINGHHRPGDVKFGRSTKGSRENGWLEDTWPGWGCGIVRDSYAEFHWGRRWQYRCPGSYMTPNQHPGQWGISIIPMTPVVTAFGYLAKPVVSVSRFLATGCLTAASYVFPPSHKWKPLPEETCASVASLTNETIHQSVYQRWLMAEKARENRPKLVDRFTTYICDIKLVRKLTGSPPRARDPSEWLATWKPKSLDGLTYNKNDKVWIGKCAVSGKEIKIPEEPEEICKVGGLMQELNEDSHKKGDWSQSRVDSTDSEWTFWLEKAFDHAEYEAIGEEEYTKKKKDELTPRPFYKRWLGLGKVKQD